MVLIKYLTSIIVMFLLLGCTAISNKKVYEEGYRQGVQEQVKEIAASFQGGNFPYYHWAAPIVQEVRVPAHVANGVMIPEHNELVIIKPGEWALSNAYPIQTQENSNDSKISYMDISNLTPLPQGVGNAANAQRTTESEDHSRGVEQSEEE